jgi:hypothetical protein
MLVMVHQRELTESRQRRKCRLSKAEETALSGPRNPKFSVMAQVGPEL